MSVTFQRQVNFIPNDTEKQKKIITVRELHDLLQQHITDVTQHRDRLDKFLVETENHIKTINPTLQTVLMLHILGYANHQKDLREMQQQIVELKAFKEHVTEKMSQMVSELNRLSITLEEKNKELVKLRSNRDNSNRDNSNGDNGKGGKENSKENSKENNRENNASNVQIDLSIDGQTTIPKPPTLPSVNKIRLPTVIPKNSTTST